MGWINLALCLGLLLAQINAQEYLPKALRGKYGNQMGQPNSNPQGVKTKTYTKTKTKSAQSPGLYNGGCTTEPPTPNNSGILCSKYSGCKAKCIPSYQFPNGETEIFIKCLDGKWGVPLTEWDNIPGCEPVCLPECLNNGICTGPNQCNCPENFSGPQCQYEKKPCLNYPTIPMNSRRVCRSTSCTVTCMSGHNFPDGSAITTMVCKDGSWIPTKFGWTSIPDCRANCNPSCQNGGNCLSFNVCQCPRDYRGPQCQYLASACSSKKLQFNGMYNCSSNSESFSCALSCPEGVPFDFPPEPLYTCRFETGTFLPMPIPTCLFGDNFDTIPVHSASSYYKSNSGSFNMNHANINGNKMSAEQPMMFPADRDKYEPNTITDDNIHFIPMGYHGKHENQYVVVDEKKPDPAVCFTWGGTHYRTFDGKIYSVESNCAHVLVRESVDNTFSIAVVNNPCEKDPDLCYRIITIYLQEKEYILKKSDKGVPILVTPKKILPIPGQLPGLRVEMVAHYVVLSLDLVGAVIKWDGQQMVQVDVNEALWNRTAGLCGLNDGDPSNDLTAKDGNRPRSLVTFISSWQVNNLEDLCKSSPNEQHVCQDAPESKKQEASEFCQKLLSDKRFAQCQSAMDMNTLIDACKWDYCSCPHKDASECACTAVNVFVKTCAHKGIAKLPRWRDDKTCPLKCTGGRIYMTCEPVNGQAVCGATSEKVRDSSVCEEGCYCPTGTYLHGNKCITKDKCPCRLRGKEFQPGMSVPKDCNTCTCNEGQWICTQISCGARCSALGDPHYITFDGKRYDFMGQCTYHLLKADNFSIEGENVACSGTISEAMNFPVSISSGLPSCTKAVNIKWGGQVIKLKQNHELVVNGLDVTKIPYTIAGITIRSVSSIYLLVELPNKIFIWWDGLTRAYIDVPANFKGKTKGLCGTFNDNQKDDFLTPENDVEQSVIPFANKWKTSEKCNDIPDKIKSHPCDVNIQNKAIAEKYCKKLKSPIFFPCHWTVDLEPFYIDCMYDMCSCEAKVAKCLCPMIAAYAEQCAAQGVKLHWRLDMPECGVACPLGQTYQICGNSCTRTCFDISSQPDCRQQCVEGCNCPPGETIDEHGECIPIGRCKCQHDGVEYPADYNELRPHASGMQLCTCINAIWDCKSASPQDLKLHPQASDSKSKCNSTRNFVFTTCESVEPVTCKNMHEENFVSAGVCHAGCECKDGYVLDTKAKACVKPTECPCHHGGRSYKENSVVQSDCNTCKCKNAKWDCSERQCSAECSAWGDSHFKTFDGKMYDYQGQCDYILAKGVLTPEDTFDVIIQNVPCGTLGVACSKSVTIKFGSAAQQESITLTRGKKVQDAQIFKHFTVRNRDMFVIVEAADLGVIVHWDKGTRVYIKVDPRWKNKVKGLCGNYNDNEMDDFQTPSGGLTEASTILFGDSWKLQSYCPETHEITDTCAQKPDRKMWALKECGILKSSIFTACHSEIPVEGYLERCVFDSCACDQGGDCECLCTALAAYAQECNNRGIPIKWRSQQLCPIQCDERCSHYSPCVSTCPVETCDNLLISSPLSKLCKEDTCIEGCVPKACPADHVYTNSSLLTCVPTSVCKPICLEVDDVIYYEGDLMEEDECHSCFCSRGKKVCKGQSCAPVLSTTESFGVTHQHEQVELCKSGWTEWINQDKPDTTLKEKDIVKYTDIEPLPDDIIMNNLKEKSKCNKEQIVNIECRTSATHLHYKETGLNVECSLERGLVCEAKKGQRPCPDFEIRVLCQCEEATTQFPPTTSIPCDSRKPNQEHPEDCHKFYQCAPGIMGMNLVEKTCGKDMLYNPESQICDWPANVFSVKPQCEDQLLQESLQTIPPEIFDGDILEPEGPNCPPGMEYDECAIQCDKLCVYYAHIVRENGACKGNTICEAGCVSAEKQVSCAPGMFWANNHTCVAIQDCMCVSHDGVPIKPGSPYKESKCMMCQCVHNYYACDKTECEEEQISGKQLGEEERGEDIDFDGILPGRDYSTTYYVTTVTPPKECSPDMYMDLIQGDQPLSDEVFTASSTLSPLFAPHNARINSKISGTSGGSWIPTEEDENPYLQINLGKMEPVYGIVIKGSSLYNKYVTSFKVLYSPTGEEDFTYVPDRNREPQLFRGPLDGNQPIQHVFYEPIEAKLIRVIPKTWNEGIALRVELIGCGERKTTLPDYFTKPPGDFCFDPMKLQDQQISVSSVYGNHAKKELSIIEGNGWRPRTNSPTEWVEFNFLEPRNITGFVTKGGSSGWVTAFRVKYSHTGKDWNPVLDELFNEKTFPGNFDESKSVTNNFDIPILSTYVKIIPIKWQKNIQLRIEMHGCYLPYPTMEVPITTVTSSPCNICPGIQNGELEMGACRCEADKWWDGENCVSRRQCPCMVGHIPYSIGTLFEKEDCSQCICKLGGVAHCIPKACEKCETGLKSTVTSTCGCVCVPCEDGTTLCPTSNICINSTSWCNGIRDCPDDEIDCITTTEAATTTEEELMLQVTHTDSQAKKPIKKKKGPRERCPTEILKDCPRDYKRIVKKVAKSERYLSTMFNSHVPHVRKNVKTSPSKTKGGTKTAAYRNQLQRPTELENPSEKKCPEPQEYKCVSTKPPPPWIPGKNCPPARCPPEFNPEFNEEEVKQKNKCPKYECVPTPDPDVICNVTGRTFNTFDETEYKYDICNHILVRDLQSLEWDITLKKNCTKLCTRNLIIHHDEHTFVLHPDMSIEFDGYSYTVSQTKQIGSNYPFFSITRLGDSLLFVSNKYGFWTIWDTQGNVKVGVSSKLFEKVDGLCGYYNKLAEDDKRHPDGTQGRTTAEFGDSWAQSEEPVECETKACPMHMQNKAWDMCNQVKSQVLSACAQIIDIDAFVSRCLETTCNCLEASGDNTTADDACRCKALESFVVDCLIADNNIELTDWRMLHDCPVDCESPLVHHDCYHRRCEPTCETISDPNICPKLNNVCFPGCYCPPGLVRKGDICIKSSTCKDCECNVLPHLQYVTYDESNFTVNGNCVYVMSRDILEKYQDDHQFQVLITNHPCRDNAEKMCVGKITILYNESKMHVYYDLYRNNLKLMVDAEWIKDFDEISDWAKVRQTKSKHFKILLIKAQVEVSVYFPSLGVSVKAPSHKYGGKLEGLCGDCNKDPDNDMRTPTGELVKDENELGPSWLYDKLPGMTKEMCTNKPAEECETYSMEEDPCLQLVDVDRFGQCHPLLDPGMFVEWCKKDICGGHPERACVAVSAYARECLSSGFCIHWHSDLCPAQKCNADQEYKPCGPSCPNTCETWKDPEKNKKCVNVPTDGCFCPEGKVMLNNTCVEQKMCEICDDEGHHPGDKWARDACTNCECQGTSLKCETKQCPAVDTVCEAGFEAVKLVKEEKDCCDKFICIPAATDRPTCEPPVELKCAPGQIMKLDTKADGCQQFICLCKPIEECDPIDTSPDAKMEDGMIKVVDESGCCPVMEKMCKPETCKQPPECEEFYKPKETDIGKCCPEHTCEPPQKCIVNFEYTADENGGERSRNKYEKQSLLIEVYDTWNDGPCRDCQCYGSPTTGYHSVCSVKDCPAPTSSPDYMDYELITEQIKGECCPLIKRAGCKHNGKTYKIGEKWIASADHCTKMECTETLGFGVQKLTQVISCDENCELGFEYKPATLESKECCGSCKPIGCVVDGKVKNIGEEWSSPDFCTNYACKDVNGSMQVQSVMVVCAQVPEDQLNDFVYEFIPVDGECCKLNKMTACKVGETFYKVGETWPSPDGDKCKKFTCSKSAQGEELVKLESVETCNRDCPKGWDYVETGYKCCGECEQIGCVVGDEIKKPGENWTSPDNCTTSSCEKYLDQFSVNSQQESCPSLEDCPAEDIYVKGCCQHCNITRALAQGQCVPEEVNAEQSIGLVTAKRDPHGKCVNKEALKGFTECVGACHSSTLFNAEIGMHESVCFCCQATKYDPLLVELTCEDGYKFQKQVAVPSACSCEGCASTTKSKKGVKTV